ncbi:MAG: YjjG family noncanonical pyrimidine nucleotidase [Clostridia bacterium]
MKYKAILFDLDDTIWDFKNNSINAIDSIRKLYQQKFKVKATSKLFRKIYEQKNEILWNEYRRGERSSESISYQRFIDVGNHFNKNVTIEEAKYIASSYLEELYQGDVLIEGAVEVLDYLNKIYVLGLITNGFKQGLIRLNRCNLEGYFRYSVSSEEFGSPKPNKNIFLHAAAKIMVDPKECIYIGDNYEGDVIGAKEAGLGAIFFNPKEKPFNQYKIKPDYNIKKLEELKEIF